MRQGNVPNLYDGDVQKYHAWQSRIQSDKSLVQFCAVLGFCYLGALRNVDDKGIGMTQDTEIYGGRELCDRL